MTQQIKLRRGTAAQATAANPILLLGELGLETDTRKFKFGDGASTWSALSYAAAGDALTSASLAQFAVTSSAQLAGVISDETGTGSLVFSTSPSFITPVLGIPSSVTLTNATGLPVSTGVSGLGAGVAAFLGTPTSANLAAALTDETGTGAAVFAVSPALTGVPTAPTAAVATNTTQVATTAFVQAKFATAGTGDVVGPASSIDGRLALFSGITGKLIQQGSAPPTGTNTGDQTITLTGDVTGSGVGSFAATIANDVVTYAKMQNISVTSRVLGRITAAAGDPEELTGANVKTIIGAISLTADVSGLLPIANGGTATATPALVAGSNVTITGAWPNQTIASAAGSTTPTTTKGDLIARSATADDRLPVGANTFVLTADSTQALGIKWAASAGGTSSLTRGKALDMFYVPTFL